MDIAIIRHNVVLIDFITLYFCILLTCVLNVDKKASTAGAVLAFLGGGL